MNVRIGLLSDTLDALGSELDSATRAFHEGRWEFLSLELTSILLIADDARAFADVLATTLDRGPGWAAALYRWRLKGGGPYSTRP